MAQIPVVLKVLAEKSASVNAVLDETKRQYASIGGAIEGVSQTALRFSAVTTGALGGIISYLVRTGGQFEQMQAKLEGLLGSSVAAQRAFSNATDIASKSPFDVSSVVNATIQIEAFGQSSRRVLPLVTSLAAGMGRPLAEVSTVLGKAFSGSAEGFESLRSTLGVTTAELRKYGAEVTGLGGVSLQTQSQIDKARNALERVIQLKFGDSVEKQSKTLFGTLSNLGDALTRVAAGLGTALIPVINSTAKAITGLVEFFEKLPQAFRTTLAASGLVAVGIGGVTTVTILLGSAVVRAAGSLTAMGAALARAGQQSTVAAGQMALATASANALATAARTASAASGIGGLAANVGARAGALTGPVATGLKFAAPDAAAVGASGAQAALAANGFAALRASIAGAAEASLAFLATPFGLAFAAISIGAIGAAAAIADLRSRTAELDAAVSGQAKEQTIAITNFKTYKAAAEQVTGAIKGFASQGNSAIAFAKEFQAALSAISPIEATRRIEQLGFSVDELRKSYERSTAQAKDFQNNIKILIAGKNALDDLNSPPELSLTGALVPVLDDKRKKELEDLKALFGGVIPTIEEVNLRIQQFGTLSNKALSTAAVDKGFIDSFEKTVPVLDKATKSAETFGVFLKEATKSTNIGSLNQVLSQLEGRISQVSGNLSSIGIPTGDIEALRGRLLDPTIRDQETKAIKSLLELLGEQEQLKKRIGDLSSAETAKEVRNVELEVERKKLARRDDFQDQIAHLQRIVAAKKLSAEEELGILRTIDSLETTIRQRKIEQSRNSLTALVQTSRGSIEELNATGQATARDVAGALTGVVANLGKWESANRALLAQHPQLKAEFTSTFQGFTKELDRAKLAVPRELLETSITKAKAFGVEAVNSEQKLAATRQGLDLLQQLQLSGQIRSIGDKKRLQEQINDLTRQEIGLKKTVTKELDEQTKLTNDLKRQGLDNQLEVLKAEQSVEGKDNTFRIKAKQQEILASKIDAIREQEKAEIDAGAKPEEAKKRTELRITQFKEAEVLRRIQLEQQETRAVDEAAKEQQAIKDRLNNVKANRFGGANSPLISVEELGLQSALQFSFTPKKIQDQPVPGRISELRRRVDTDIAEGSKAAPQKPKTPEDAGALAGAKAGDTWTVVYNGERNTDPDLDAKARQFGEAGAAKARKDLLNGRAAPRGVL